MKTILFESPIANFTKSVYYHDLEVDGDEYTVWVNPAELYRLFEANDFIVVDIKSVGLEPNTVQMRGYVSATFTVKDDSFIRLDGASKLDNVVYNS